MKRIGTRAHALLYRLSGGRILGRIGGQDVLLLQTVGRRTGRSRSTPVQYLPHDHAFVVVAANRGAARPPAWYLNLCAAPRARVRVGSDDVEVLARELGGTERDALWRQLTAANRYLEGVARQGRTAAAGAHARAVGYLVLDSVVATPGVHAFSSLGRPL